MYDTLLDAKTGANSSALLLPRQTQDQQVFFCTGDETDPFAYLYTLKNVAGSICGLFTYGVGKAGKLQIVQGYGFEDVGGKPMQAIFKYGWKIISFASVEACATAMEYAINNACALGTVQRLHDQQFTFFTAGQKEREKCDQG